MENLHLKNLKNIYSLEFIENRLNNIETPHYVINNFKETYINDLYSNKTRYLIKVGIKMIKLLNVIKNFEIGKTIKHDELSKLLNNDNIINIYCYKNHYEMNIYYYTKSENELDTEYREIIIDLDNTHKILSIYKP